MSTECSEGRRDRGAQQFRRTLLARGPSAPWQAQARSRLVQTVTETLLDLVPGRVGAWARRRWYSRF